MAVRRTTSLSVGSLKGSLLAAEPYGLWRACARRASLGVFGPARTRGAFHAALGVVAALALSAQVASGMGQGVTPGEPDDANGSGLGAASSAAKEAGAESSERVGTAHGAVPAVPSSSERAAALARAGELDAAAALYGEHLAAHPNDEDASLARARVLAWLGRFAEAEAALATLLGANPSYADVWSALGDLYRWQGRHEEAIAAYQRGVSLDTANSALRLGLAESLSGLRRYPEARAELAEARARGAEPERVEALERALASGRAAPPWEVKSWGRFLSTLDTTDDWVTLTTALERHFDFGALLLEGLGSHRERLGPSGAPTGWDEAVAAEAYVDVWKRATAHARFQWAFAATVFPRTDALLELTDGVGESWEVSAFYRNMAFTDNAAHIAGLSVGKYQDAWFLRALASYAPVREGQSGLAAELLARRYADTVDDFLELRVVGSRDVVVIPAVSFFEKGWSLRGVLRGQLFVARWFGLQADATYQLTFDDPDLWGLSAGTLFRF